MDTNTMFSFVDMIVVACGVYVIYLCVEMKLSGKLKQNMLMPRGYDVTKCKDTAGYIRTIAVKQMLLGVFALVCGAVGLLQDFGVGFVKSPVYLLTLLAFVIYAVWYTRYMKKVLRKFW